MERLLLNPIEGGRKMVFLFILGIIILLLVFSKIRIEIQNFKFTTQNKQHINTTYRVTCKWKILRKIPIAKITITNQKIRKWNMKEKMKKINTEVLQNANKIDKKIIEAIKHANIQYKKINLKIEIGTQNACLTSFLIPAISTVIAIWLRQKMQDNKNQTFIVQPIYQNKNLVNIQFSGIFEIKMIHIINIIYILNKKGSVKENERTSHRRTYDYSYE